MAMQFRFLTDQLDGTAAELFLMQPMIAGSLMPVLSSVVTVNGGVATFPTAPQAPFAVRVRDGSTTFVSTGVIDLSSGILDEDTGDYSAAYLVVQPDATTFTPDALAGLVPPLPRVSDDEDGNPQFSLTTLTLTITGGLINATGTGVYLQTPVGGSVSFNYLFRLVPNTSALNAGRILKVVTESASVTSTDGSIFGFMVNLVGNFLLWIMQEDVVSQIEDTLQAEIDLAVRDALADAGAGAGITVTATSVTTDTAAGITVSALAAINAQSVCPTGLTFGSIRMRPVAQIRALAAMRNLALRGSPRGDLYLQMFRRHKAELLRLLIRHPELLKQADATVAAGLKDYSPKEPARGVMSRGTAKHAARLLEMVGKLGSPELAALARALTKEVPAFVGRPAGEVLGRGLCR